MTQQHWLHFAKQLSSRLVTLISIFIITLISPISFAANTYDDSPALGQNNISDITQATEFERVRQETLRKAKKLKLSEHPTWRKLLHVEPGSLQSAVLSQSFFLSPEGETNSDEELIATINAYFETWPENTNKHPRCRYPARYHWLNKHLSLPRHKIDREQNCRYLSDWGLYKTTDSVSLLLVSGYLGNPASSFGHTLLKLNSSQINKSSDLFAKTVNYGAVVPPGDSTFRYITFGIFGGYKAVFSNHYFFTQDRVYSRTEFRDMWDYELALSEDQITFLMLHIWEITGRDYKYFFFDKNCAYRIAQLIELVDETSLSKHQRPWYLPEVLFHNLNQTPVNPQNPLLKNISFIPSSQRVLYQQMALLHKDEVDIVNDILADGDNSKAAWQAISQKDKVRKIILLDTLLFYQQYLLIASKNEEDDFLKKLKQKTLLARLSLPIEKKTRPPKKYLPSPAEGNKASTLGIAGISQEHNQQGILLNLAAFKRDHSTRNSLEGNELVLLDFNFKFTSDDHKLDSVNLIKASNLKPASFTLSQENHWAWQVSAGSKKQSKSENYNSFFKSGIGKSIALNSQLFAYGLAGPYFFTEGSNARAGTKVGLIFNEQHFNLSSYADISWNSHGEKDSVLNVLISTSLSQQTNIILNLSKDFEKEAQLGIHFYF